MTARARYHHTDFWGLLVRRWYRLSQPPKLRHMARTLPYLKLKPAGDAWDVYWKGRKVTRTAPWSELKAGAPERLYVIGSGPSIREQYIDRLAGEACVLLNGAIALTLDGTLGRPFAVMVEDARFILEKGDMLKRLPRGTRLCLVGSALRALGEVDPELFSHFRLYFIQGFETPYGRPRRSLEAVDPRHFRQSGRAKLSLNMEEGHFGCGTVMYCGIQLAFYLRVRALFLVGFDMTNFEQPRFYESERNAAWTGLVKAYHGRVLPAMELAAHTARDVGMTIENCSHTSAIPRTLFPFNDRLM
ncbi:hypothetical protein [Saccharospirillum salsuginis]|uniref:Glycosyl transferase n=1 Tax=Saccharospirillum salsuginis TaxID=418750 RepID=A0A918KGB7_9GAMM|nr:hypothetical protein [Saccharospirillum salsuginis]GGX60452.1 glycosyl transferase [Saccharospirillum salsuginis]